MADNITFLLNDWVEITHPSGIIYGNNDILNFFKKKFKIDFFYTNTFCETFIEKGITKWHVIDIAYWEGLEVILVENLDKGKKYIIPFICRWFYNENYIKRVDTSIPILKHNLALTLNKKYVVETEYGDYGRKYNIKKLLGNFL